jgi:hypothetical protein
MSLTLMPCGDLAQYGAHNHEEIGINIDFDHASHQPDNDHRDEADTCSPFCICACCGVVYNFEFYASNLNSNDFIYIWKPPKIS